MFEFFAAIVCTTSILMYIHMIATFILMRILISRDDFVPDADRIEEQCNEYLLGRFLLALHPIAFWWINGPVFLYFRFVKGDKTVSFSSPKSRDRPKL